MRRLCKNQPHKYLSSEHDMMNMKELILWEPKLNLAKQLENFVDLVTVVTSQYNSMNVGTMHVAMI